MQKLKTLDLKQKEKYRLCRDWTQRSIDFLEKVGLTCEDIQRARMTTQSGKILHFSDVLGFLDKMHSYLEEAYTKAPLKISKLTEEVSNPLPLIRSPDGET